MRIIFGIGNPGIRYEFTRHNAGFLLLDYYANKLSLNFIESSGEYLHAHSEINHQEFLLVKPVTYVNNSGIVFKEILGKYEVLPENVLVVCDDTNLKKYELRIRLSGGDGGHNGLSSIIYHLQSDQFARIRIGIGNKPIDVDLAEYVLSEFSKTELEEYRKTFETGSILIQEFIIGGTKKMLEINSLLSKPENTGD